MNKTKKLEQIGREAALRYPKLWEHCIKAARLHPDWWQNCINEDEELQQHDAKKFDWLYPTQYREIEAELTQVILPIYLGMGDAGREKRELIKDWARARGQSVGSAILSLLEAAGAFENQKGE